MKTKASSFDDIIFEYRNKEYGAYANRLAYSKIVLRSLLIVLILLLGIVFFFFFKYYSITTDYNYYVEYVNSDFVRPPEEKCVRKFEKKTRKKDLQRFVVPLIVSDTSDACGDLEQAKDSADNSILSYATPQGIGDIKLFYWVEEMPQFPGGDCERIKFLSDNIVYPEQARKSGIQGNVYFTFVVNEDGNISNINILRGIGGGCDEEVLRIIGMMPQWIPGRQNGIAVKVSMSMIISFKQEIKQK